MIVSETGTGLPGNSGDGSYISNAEQSNEFYIFDSSCNARGAYAPGSCSTPWWIEENFLKDVLTITNVFMDVSDAFFSFDYGDGTYLVNNNQCGCENEESFPTATTICKCAFPVDGHFGS